MTREELIELARTRVDDVNLPYLVSDESFEGFADEAVMEAARRSRLKLTSTLTIPVIAGQVEYDLPVGIILLRKVKFSGRCPLCFTNSDTLDENVCDWESIEGDPTHVITDVEEGKIKIYPKPLVNGALTLSAIVEPNVGTDVLDIPSRFHYGLVDWLAYRYYGIHDADVHDLKAEQRYYLRFIEEFGSRSSAENEIYDHRNGSFGNDGSY